MSYCHIQVQIEKNTEAPCGLEVFRDIECIHHYLIISVKSRSVACKGQTMLIINSGLDGTLDHFEIFN